jgi:hypothetical protein
MILLPVTALFLSLESTIWMPAESFRQKPFPGLPELLDNRQELSYNNITNRGKNQEQTCLTLRKTAGCGGTV